MEISFQWEINQRMFKMMLVGNVSIHVSSCFHIFIYIGQLVLGPKFCCVNRWEPIEKTLKFVLRVGRDHDFGRSFPRWGKGSWFIPWFTEGFSNIPNGAWEWDVLNHQRFLFGSSMTSEFSDPNFVAFFRLEWPVNPEIHHEVEDVWHHVKW